MFSSTIAAISTPRGCGGIALIRISGDDAINISDKFIRTKCGRRLSDAAANSALTSDITDDDGSVLDTGIVTIFRAPRSFTGEDTVEISCHGGILLSAQVLARAISCGAVQAAPGEFTRRAFSAGKLTLSQAEGISDMIYAKSRAALRLSRTNADGALSKRSDEIYGDMKNVLSAVYAGIDFPDEDLSPVTNAQMKEQIRGIIDRLQALKDSYKTGRAVVEGIPTVICGKPNTGKSTLLNLLCGSERAIVTDIAGTTRDVITESVVCGNATLLISDTAGIHDTTDIIESVGVGRSLDKIEGCELIIAVFDSSSPLDRDDEKIISLIKKQRASGASAIAVFNKSDICSSPDISEVKGVFDITLVLSAKDDTSLKPIAEAVNGLFSCGRIGTEENAVITNARQYAKVCNALQCSKSALEALKDFGEDFAGAELEAAMSVLGELDGRRVGIEIVDDIFARFCVGK